MPRIAGAGAEEEEEEEEEAEDGVSARVSCKLLFCARRLGMKSRTQSVKPAADPLTRL